MVRIGISVRSPQLGYGAISHELDGAGRRWKPRSYGATGAYLPIYLWAFGTMAAALGIFLLLRAV